MSLGFKLVSAAFHRVIINYTPSRLSFLSLSFDFLFRSFHSVFGILFLAFFSFYSFLCLSFILPFFLSYSLTCLLASFFLLNLSCHFHSFQVHFFPFSLGPVLSHERKTKKRVPLMENLRVVIIFMIISLSYSPT